MAKSRKMMKKNENEKKKQASFVERKVLL